MTRSALLLLPLLLAACTTPPATVQIDGAETRGNADRPRIATARLQTIRTTPAMELVSGDGALFTGQLARVERPMVTPLSTAGLPEAAGTELVGDISSPTETLACRFLLLNPSRGVDGGGSGRCVGAARRVEFTF